MDLLVDAMENEQTDDLVAPATGDVKHPGYSVEYCDIILPALHIDLCHRLGLGQPLDE